MIPWETFLTWQKDWFEIYPYAIESRRKFLADTPFLSQAHFKHARDTVRFGRRMLVKDYAYAYVAQLALDSSVATTPHRKRLLDLAEEHEINQSPDPQRWFEGLSLFDQSISVAHIEARDPIESISTDINQMIKFIIARLFVGGFRKIEVHSYHDPKNGYAVTADNISIDHPLDRPRLDERVVPMTCRQIEHNGFTYMDHRIKDPFETWLKIHRQIKEKRVKDPFFVNDRCGLVFVLFSREECFQFAERLTNELLCDGGEIIERLETNSDGKTVDAENLNSSPNFKAAKMLVKCHGRVFEFQFVTFHDYITSTLSLTDANHELYKLRQALNFSLPLLWPESLYGVNWADEEIRERLFVCKESQLGWRVMRKDRKRIEPLLR